MDRTSTPPATPDGQAALDPRTINLRPFWRWRVGLAFVSMAAAIAFLGLMTFGSGSMTAAAPDPAAAAAEAEAELGRLVAQALERARPPGEPVALPRSQHARGGLLLPTHAR